MRIGTDAVPGRPVAGPSADAVSPWEAAGVGCRRACVRRRVPDARCWLAVSAAPPEGDGDDRDHDDHAGQRADPPAHHPPAPRPGPLGPPPLQKL
jgi:hypothetical protein